MTIVNTDTIQTPVVLEWQSPKAFSLWLSQKTLKEAQGRLLRTMLFVLLFLAVIYFGLGPLPWQLAGVNFKQILLVMLVVGFGLSFLLYFASPFCIRFKRVRYKVDAKGIRLGDKLFRWKTIGDCESPKPNEQFSGVLQISFATRFCRRRQFLVFGTSQEELAVQVYLYIRDRVPQQGMYVLKPLFVFSRSQHICMVAFSLIGAVVLDAFIVPWAFQSIPEDYAGIILVAILLAGPGTWGVLALYGRKLLRFRDWLAPMLMYNGLTFFLMMIIRTIIIVHRLREVFR
jgi:hypothetical protein